MRGCKDGQAEGLQELFGEKGFVGKNFRENGRGSSATNHGAG